MTVELREARPDELGTVESLLETYDLPTADVRSGDATFYLAETDEAIVGVGGLEVSDRVALLRSVAAQEPGQGYGRTICSRLEERAQAAGAAALYLLTETAPGFFDRLGYERIDPDEAPAAVRETTQYRELCGETAVLMRKRL